MSLCFLPAAVQKGKHAHRRVLTAKLYFVHVRTQRWKMFLLLLTSSAIFFAIAFFIGLPLVSALDFIVFLLGSCRFNISGIAHRTQSVCGCEHW